MLSLRRLARFLLPAVLALAPALVRAQVCEGSVWLDTQAEVDAFACTEVTGDLHIGGTLFYPYDQSDIYNLDALSSLTAVGGKLEIVVNPILGSIAPLASIVEVHAIQIEKNSQLLSLQGLEGISSVGGSVVISDNESLESLVGLDNIASVGGDLRIQDTPLLENLAPLAGLTSIGGVLGLVDVPLIPSLNRRRYVHWTEWLPGQH